MMVVLCFQILVMLEATEEVNVESVVRYVSGLQNEDGSFSGDKWGEVDTRFSFCAVACLALLVGAGAGFSFFLFFSSAYSTSRLFGGTELYTYMMLYVVLSSALFFYNHV